MKDPFLFKKIANNVREIGEDLKSLELTKEDKLSLKKDLEELIGNMEQTRDNFAADRKRKNS